MAEYYSHTHIYSLLVSQSMILLLCNWQPIWNAIIDFDPQVFIWLGDNVYGDTKRPFKLFGKERTIGPWKNAPRFIPSSPKELESRYQKAKSNPGYSRLRHTTQVPPTYYFPYTSPHLI
jgi:hypothetical protein